MKQKDARTLNRQFGLVMAGGFSGLAVLRFILTQTLSPWLLGLAALFLAGGLLCPAWLGPLRNAWMKLAVVLGFINSRILLTIVFALVITPTALILRLIGKRPIQLGPAPESRSYWRPRQAGEFSRERMERQF